MDRGALHPQAPERAGFGKVSPRSIVAGSVACALVSPWCRHRIDQALGVSWKMVAADTIKGTFFSVGLAWITKSLLLYLGAVER